MHVVLVEDDPMQEESIREMLEKQLPSGTRITCIQTESSFRENLPHIIQDPPQVIVMDVMMRWTDAALEMPEPPHDVTDVMGGLRCLKALRDEPRTRTLPVILYSVLDKKDLSDYGFSLESDPAVRWQTKDVSGLSEQIMEAAKAQVGP